MWPFTPVWKSENEEKALKAVEKMTDELARVAREALNWRVRVSAVKKLTDQEILTDIAKNDKNRDVCETAVDKLTNQVFLAGVAKNANNIEIRMYAAKKIIDKDIVQKIYTEIAQDEGLDEDIRTQVAEQITEPVRQSAAFVSILESLFKMNIDIFSNKNRKRQDMLLKILTNAPNLFNARKADLLKAIFSHHSDYSSGGTHNDEYGSHQDMKQATVLGSSDCHHDMVKPRTHTDNYPYGYIMQQFPSFFNCDENTESIEKKRKYFKPIELNVKSNKSMSDLHEHYDDGIIKINTKPNDNP